MRLDEPGFGEQRVSVADARADSPLAESVHGLLELGGSAVVETAGGEVVSVEAFAPPPNLYIVGISEHVAALARLGAFLGYRVTVCDPRSDLLTPEKYPMPTNWWPNGPTAFFRRRRSTRALRSAC